MKYQIIIIFIVNSFYSLAQMPGSGNCLDFDGTNDVLETTHNQSFANTGNEFTIECWIKSSDGSTENNAFVTNYGGTGQTPFFMLGFDNSNLFFWCRDASNTSSKPSVAKGDFLDGTWHHLAGVRSSTATILYLDGVQVASEAAGTGDLRFGTTLSIMDHYNRYTFGQMDEIRIWNDARTQAEIRDNMCQKLSGSEANLELYYRLDQSITTSVADNSSNSNTGTLINMAPSTDWIVSGAPIGDTSSYLYTGTWAANTVNLNSTNKGNMEVNSVSGNPDGLHLYRVDAIPNSTIAISPSLGSSDLYYGSFVVGGISPTYSVEYDYTNYVDAINQEPDLLLYNRDDNTDPSWIDISATVDTAANTLIKTVVSSRGEFIIAGASSALPIELISFHAINLDDKKIKLEWQTASEVNNDYFTIERSKNGVDWEELNKIDGAGNSSTLLHYSTIDLQTYSGLSYYRLKQTDFDGKFEYSKIRSVSIDRLVNEVVELYPNPTSNLITVTGSLTELEDIIIYNVLRQNVTSLTQQIEKNEKTTILDLSGLKQGVYYIKTKTTANKVYKQ